MNAPFATQGSELPSQSVSGGTRSLVHRLSLVLYPDTLLRTVCEPWNPLTAPCGMLPTKCSP